MPVQPTNRKTISDIILDLFRDTFKQGPFKLFREGDPMIFPQSALPALVIHEDNTSYDNGPTGHDEILHELVIQVIFNKKDELGKPNDEVTLTRTIDDIVQARDITTGDFKDNTILGVIRRKITLGNISVNNEVTVEKGVIPRSETLTTEEAHIRIRVTELQAVANRN